MEESRGWQRGSSTGKETKFSRDAVEEVRQIANMVLVGRCTIRGLRGTASCLLPQRRYRSYSVDPRRVGSFSTPGVPSQVMVRTIHLPGERCQRSSHSNSFELCLERTPSPSVLILVSVSFTLSHSLRRRPPLQLVLEVSAFERTQSLRLSTIPAGSIGAR